MRSRSIPDLVPADDRGLLLGDGLFETVRLRRGRPFRLDRHLLRLESSARLLGIPVPGELGQRVSQALLGWEGVDGALRITLTRGAGAGVAPPTDPRPRLIVTVQETESDPEHARRGLSARVLGRLDEKALVTALKVTAYPERIQAIRLARSHGADEALLRNSRDRLVEGAASNLYAVTREGVLLAPGPEEGALAGITRELLLELAAELRLSVEERGVEVEEVAGLTEIFLSSSIRGVVAVTELDGHPVGSGSPGPVLLKLQRGLEERVAREVPE